jgi:hypothetical protein
MPDEHRFLVDGRIPVLKMHFEPRPGPAVIVLHGLGASSEVQRPELNALAHSGLTAVAIDAPHHGARRDWLLDEIDRSSMPWLHEHLLRLILESAPDVSRVIDHLIYEGHGPIGLAGISLGAYTALTVATWDPRVRATVSILGSPDWTPRDGNITDELRELMRHAPVHRPWELARHPLMLVNGGRDGMVPAHWAREFAQRVHELPHWPGRHVEYIEYPESDHMMRGEDWEDLWKRARGFLRWHLR